MILNQLNPSSFCCAGGSEPVAYQTCQMSISYHFSNCFWLEQGSQYIQTSFLGYHGDLRSTKCVLDKLFRLKLSDIPNGRLEALLCLQCRMPLNCTELLWTSPDVLRGDLPKSPWNDMYALGIIIHEICYQKGPFGLGPRAGILEKDAAGMACAEQWSKLWANSTWSCSESDPIVKAEVAGSKMRANKSCFPRTQINGAGFLLTSPPVDNMMVWRCLETLREIACKTILRRHKTRPENWS